MGTTNYRFGMEQRLAQQKGELIEIRKQIDEIETGIAQLSQLHDQAKKLEGAIAAGEQFILFDRPDWQPDKIKPVNQGRWKSPFKNGEQGRVALGILRESGDWLTCNDMAKEMLRRVGHNPDDRLTRERVANTIGNYMRKHEGDLVESDGQYPKKWRVIR